MFVMADRSLYRNSAQFAASDYYEDVRTNSGHRCSRRRHYRTDSREIRRLIRQDLALAPTADSDHSNYGRSNVWYQRTTESPKNIQELRRGRGMGRKGV